MAQRDDLDLAVVRLSWRLDQVERYQKEVVRPLVKRVDRLERSEEIADGVAARMRSDRRLVLTAWQQVLAAIVAACAVAGLLLPLLGAGH